MCAESAASSPRLPVHPAEADGPVRPEQTTDTEGAGVWRQGKGGVERSGRSSSFFPGPAPCATFHLWFSREELRGQGPAECGSTVQQSMRASSQPNVREARGGRCPTLNGMLRPPVPPPAPAPAACCLLLACQVRRTTPRTLLLTSTGWGAIYRSSGTLTQTCRRCLLWQSPGPIRDAEA